MTDNNRSLAQQSGHQQIERWTIGIGDGGQGGHVFFSGNFYVKFGHYSGKNHVKSGNFVNFSGKYNKNSGIVIIFRTRIM